LVKGHLLLGIAPTTTSNSIRVKTMTSKLRFCALFSIVQLLFLYYKSAKTLPFQQDFLQPIL